MVDANSTRTKKVEVAPNATPDFKNVSFGDSPNSPTVRLPADKA
jgi:hypothetical protein